MVCAANDDWLEDLISVVPHTEYGNSLEHGIPSEAQDRISAVLRAMYADLLLEPLSPKLAQLIQQIGAHHETSQHAS